MSRTKLKGTRNVTVKHVEIEQLKLPGVGLS